MASESDKHEADAVDNAFTNPVLKTYLPSRHVYAPCLALLLGLAMIISGPLAGSLLRHSTARSLSQRQSIDTAISCFRQQSDNQQCTDAYTLSITFFAVTNADDVQMGNAAPVLTERGPYAFEAKHVHGHVAYLDDAVQFTERTLELTAACGTCNEEMTILSGDGLRTGTPTELATDLLRQPDAVVVLSTGASSDQGPYRVITYDGEQPSSMEAVYEAKLVGDAYAADDAISVFDRTLETTLEFSPVSNVKQRGLEATKLQLSDCRPHGGNCEEAEWEVEGVIYTLPYRHLNNGTTSASSPSSASYAWEIVVDRHYGYTLSTTRHYQQNHRIDSYGGSFWAASHWMTVSTSATDDDVDFIKTTLRKTRTGYILLDLVMTLTGVITVVLSSAIMCCTPSARARLRLLAVRARSRARDPRLNIGQFTSLGKFLERQLRGKQPAQSTDQANKSGQESVFNDVRSMPATTYPTV